MPKKKQISYLVVDTQALFSRSVHLSICPSVRWCVTLVHFCILSVAAPSKVLVHHCPGPSVRSKVACIRPCSLYLLQDCPAVHKFHSGSHSVYMFHCLSVSRSISSSVCFCPSFLFTADGFPTHADFPNFFALSFPHPNLFFSPFSHHSLIHPPTGFYFSLLPASPCLFNFSLLHHPLLPNSVYKYFPTNISKIPNYWILFL